MPHELSHAYASDAWKTSHLVYDDFGRVDGMYAGQHDESGKRECVVYYLSKKFTACEMNYSLLERTCCALV